MGGCHQDNRDQNRLGLSLKLPETKEWPVRTEGGSYVHIRRAISHTLSSLRLSSSMERPFPTTEEAKPHCGRAKLEALSEGAKLATKELWS